ncbi:molybdopterin-dependent oxidoreductase [Paenibacillus turpanensis]|uniref:molybdopterin-dependent oxidoreductase n=1 Tax=Paenibacillus turpanensis TaxID=2689078 RepID=UPI00140D651C|nr:molybdopterin-dependent oxidoreductase [Paenibacillus turpanensis]
MNITVMQENKQDTFTVEGFAAVVPSEEHFPLAQRVPGVEGLALDLMTWHKLWISSGHTVTDKETAAPTHLKVEAADEFQAVIPWNELMEAAVLFQGNDGQPLHKGYPVRLYVPNGSSECLNVKSVTRIWFLHDLGGADKSSYGFKNEVSIDQLKWKG